MSAFEADYAAYHLTIRSSVPLPDLPRSGDRTEPDIVISRAALDGLGAQGPTDGASPNRALPDGSAYLSFPGAGRFLVREGKEIIVDPVPNVDAGLLRLYLLGPALGTVLHQRGLVVLHASAVEVGVSGALFLGQSGKGKSTLAAALHRHGHRVIADDVAALTVTAAGPVTVIPTFPQLKLWPDSTQAMGDDPAQLPRLHAGAEKRQLPLAQGFADRSAEVGALFCLRVGDAPSLQRIAPQEALFELLSHSYCGLLLRSRVDSAYFLRCAQVARVVPAYALTRTATLRDIAETVDAVEEGMRR